MSSKRLGVNIDHIATIRQARRSTYPDPVTAAALAEIYGADQITCHIRSDRRHIQDQDVIRLRDTVQTQLNVEMAATDEMLELVGTILSVHPNRHRVTLVPENPTEITTEGGLNVTENKKHLSGVIQSLQKRQISVSLFIDPEIDQVQSAYETGVDMIEFNTAKYSEGEEGEIGRIFEATQEGLRLGLKIAAGHGLTHHNLGALIRGVPEIEEYNIGHSIVSQSVFIGWERAIRDILEIIRGK